LLLNVPLISSQKKSETGKVTLNFSISTGYSVGGPSNKLDNFLINSGYDWALKPKNYMPLIIDLNKTISNSLRVGIKFCTFRQDLFDELYGWANTDFKTDIAGFYFSWNVKNTVFFNAGPALNHVTCLHSTGSSLGDDENYLNTGVIFDALIKFPQKSRVNLQIEVLYS
jgi:hypothetical protein